jgi:hypothetical protein
MTLKFGNLYIDQIFLVSEELMTPMLIRCDFCTANGLILDFQREILSMRQKEQSIEIEFMNRKEEVRGGENCSEARRNKQAIALPTPMSDPGQPMRGSKPHSLETLPCDNEPCDPDPERLCKGKSNRNFQFRCLPNGETGVEGNYGDKDYNGEGVSNPLSKCSFLECRNKGHVAHKVRREGDVCILSVATKRKITGDIQKRHYDTVKGAKTQAANPGDRESVSESVL